MKKRYCIHTTTQRRTMYYTNNSGHRWVYRGKGFDVLLLTKEGNLVPRCFAYVEAAGNFALAHVSVTVKGKRKIFALSDPIARCSETGLYICHSPEGSYSKNNP